METTSLKLFLQSLCHNSPWDYAVFWKLHNESHMLLTLEDGYYNMRSPRGSDEFVSSTCELSAFIESLDGLSFGPAMAEMATTCYAIGEGVVGEAAYIGVPRWVFPDSIANDGFSSSLLVSQCADEWLPQFAAGIKTILLIPIMPEGVLQLGSFETVAEDAELVTYIEDKFAADQKFADYPSSLWSSVEVQHQSSVMMSTLAENSDESSANMRSNTSRNPNALENFREKVDHMRMMNVVAPVNHQLFEQNKSEMTTSKTDRSVSRHEIGVLSSSINNNTRLFSDYSSEMIDFYLDGGAMEPLSKSNDNNTTPRDTSKFLSFPRTCELHRALGPDITDYSIQHIQGSSEPFGVVPSSSVYSGDFNHFMEPSSWDSDGCFLSVNNEDILLEAGLTNASSISDYGSFNLPTDACSFEYPTGRFISHSEGHGQSPQSCVMSGASYRNALNNSSPSTSSYNPITKFPIVDKPQEKGYELLHHKKTSNLSTTNKKRARYGNHQKPKPRDRQLIQDRVKELRELVPNVAKCSIDGLLDKTIKHMMFLQGITDRADKLRQQVVKEVSERVRPKSHETKDNGTSWALDLSSEKQICPIIVKDLEFPGQMLIEMVCDDYGRFSEIADVIHRLKLTILKGVMEKLPDGTRARFIVETTGSFHRLDLFWPLMQLLQQNTAPISSKI